MHPYIYIGSLTLPAYGVCALIGALLAFAVLHLSRRHSIFSEDNLLDAIIFALVFGMVGAKLLYFIKDPPSMPGSLSELWELLSTGLVFYGGLLGGIGGVALAARKTKKPFLAYCDWILPAFCFAHACGRIGCLLAGCCYGVEAEGLFTVELGGVQRLAVQPMEAAFLVLLGIFLCILYKKRLRRGAVTGFYMTLYALWRFIIEFWRDDDRGFVGALSTSQFIGLFIFAAGVLLLYLSKKYGWPRDIPQAAKAAKE